MGVLITPTRAPSRVKSPEGDLLFLRKNDFLGFSPEPFPRAITAVIITTTTTAIATVTPIITAITATAIGNTPTKVKALPFKEIF